MGFTGAPVKWGRVVSKNGLTIKYHIYFNIYKFIMKGTGKAKTYYYNLTSQLIHAI